jgi:multidrug efflux pump subunit AcrA (membrane-fusion protein)
VVERNIDLGQFVSAGATVSTVYSTDTAEVRLPITDKDLMFIDIGNQSNHQSDVTLNATVGGKNRTWTGKLVRSEGILDSGSRVLYAVVEVKDPYQFNGGDNATLRFGQFVQAKIVSHQKQDLTVIPRSILRLDNTVLTVNDNREIEIVPVDVVRTTAEQAFIGGGLNSGALVVTSAVPNPYNGMKVRLPGDEPAMPPEAENDKKADSEIVGVKDDTTETSPVSSGSK